LREEQALDRYRDRNKARNALNAATDRVAELEGALAEAQRLTKDWNHPNADAIADLGHPTKDEPRTTKTGRVLTDADFEQLADEAEQGYDVDHVVERPPKDELRREDVEAMADTITAQQPAQPLIVHPASHPHQGRGSMKWTKEQADEVYAELRKRADRIAELEGEARDWAEDYRKLHILASKAQTRVAELEGALAEIAAERPRGPFIRVDAENMRSIARAALHPTKDEPPEDESAYTEDTGYLGDGDGSDMPSKDEPTDRGGS
jgi:hypothetical protein